MSSTHLRNKTINIARSFYTIFQIVTIEFGSYQLTPSPDGLGWGAWSAFSWAGLSLLGTLWINYRFPELKDWGYLEFDTLFAKEIPARNFSTTELKIPGSPANQERERTTEFHTKLQGVL